MFVSSDARTFNEPPASWNIGTWEDKATYFAGSPQSLAGDLIRAGVTGIAGHVAEPFLEATIRPDILFPAYVSGFNLAEAYYLALPFLSWQTVVVGDPLCAPFRASSLSSQQIDKGIDEGTELPAYFGPRRMQASSVVAYQKALVHPDTTRLLIRAEARVAKGDFAGARRLLEEATARDSRIISAQLTLASLYEQAGEYDKAIERYQLMLQMNPGNPIALNNLAYALAVRKNSPQEALPMAEKAYSASQGNASIADTLGWIHHLLGDDQKAKSLLEEALKGGQANADMHFHAAVIHAALGEDLGAAASLEQALQLDPTLATRDDVRQLQSKLQKK
jgi:Tfp pilus assembly protein PilF